MMINPYIVLLIIIVIAAIIFLIVFTIVSVRQEIENERNNPIVDPTLPCVRATSQLIDISENPCCCIGGGQTDFRYVESLDLVVAPTPTYFLDACAGFCENGLYNPQTELCLTGDSGQFTACVQLTKPIDCKDPAMPVAVNGVIPFYAHSATMDECPATGNCAPLANTCPLKGT